MNLTDIWFIDMKITKDWIHKHKTKRGAWTRHQIQALGLTWPQHAGWITRIVGKEITDEQQKQFEDGKNIMAKKSNDCFQKGNNVAAMHQRIIDLEDWIATTGYEKQICTKSILGNECLGCWCFGKSK